jgi:hypothetical protein
VDRVAKILDDATWNSHEANLHHQKRRVLLYGNHYLDLMLRSDIMHFANESAKEQTIRIRKDPKNTPSGIEILT